MIDMNLKDKTWKAYQRRNGKKGIRNKLLVIYTVECASFVAKEIVRKIGDNDTEVIGFSGCTDNAYAVRLLIALIRHPNVGGVLAVGLGCEYVQPEWLAELAAKEGKASGWFFIQEAGGTRKGIDKGLTIAAEIIKQLQEVPVTIMGFSDLIIGAECGGSDYTSGLAGNAVVGHFYDWFIDKGGTALFEEIVEAVGLKEFLCKRAANARAKKELSYTYDKALEYCKSVNQYSVSPGNFAGGLSTIEEKSMGALIKSGSKPIQGVLKVGEVPRKQGLWLLDSTPDPYWMGFGITNPNDNEGLMDLIASGAHITFLVTGRGNVVGSAVAPVIKVTGNSETYKRLIEDMDFDAGRVLEGLCTQEELIYELAELTVKVADGNLTKGEILGHKEYFIPYKFQEKKVSYAALRWGCHKLE